MKTLPEAMKERISAEVTTLCRCWILTRADGVKMGFTDHDEALEIEQVTCEAASGVEAGNIESTLGLNVDSQSIEGALSSLAISENDIAANLYDQSVLAVYVVDWVEPSLNFKENEYIIGEISSEDGAFKAELRGVSAKLDQSQGRRCSRSCAVDLGSQRCRVDLTIPKHQAISTIEEYKNSMLIRVSGLSGFPEAWFTGGRLTINNGPNAGQSIEIAKHIKEDDQVSLSLWQPFSDELILGQQLTVRVGCDKSFETCRNKFSNQINFQGFPHLPGNDFAMSYAANSETMDGGPLIP